MTDLEALARLSRALGEPARDVAILAEGNTSVRTGRDRMLVKASGSSLAGATTADFVELDTRPLVRLVDNADAGDDEITQVLTDATVDVTGSRPSMEALLHAVLMTETDRDVFAHTHPVAVNALLCSDRADALIAGSLFPDQVVVLGRHNLLVGYADPGLKLARAVRAGLRDHLDRYGGPPKVIYLANHGIFALAADPAEALAITDMTVKVARILSGALAVGEPRYLSDDETERLDTRPDEVYRRNRLSDGGGR